MPLRQITHSTPKAIDRPFTTRSLKRSHSIVSAGNGGKPGVSQVLLCTKDHNTAAQSIAVQQNFLKECCACHASRGFPFLLAFADAGVRGNSSFGGLPGSIIVNNVENPAWIRSNLSYSPLNVTNAYGGIGKGYPLWTCSLLRPASTQ